MLLPMEKAVRLLGVSISGFSIGETERAEQTALAILHRVQESALRRLCSLIPGLGVL